MCTTIYNRSGIGSFSYSVVIYHVTGCRRTACDRSPETEAARQEVQLHWLQEAWEAWGHCWAISLLLHLSQERRDLTQGLDSDLHEENTFQFNSIQIKNQISLEKSRWGFRSIMKNPELGFTQSISQEVSRWVGGVIRNMLMNCACCVRYVNSIQFYLHFWGKSGVWVLTSALCCCWAMASVMALGSAWTHISLSTNADVFTRLPHTKWNTYKKDRIIVFYMTIFIQQYHIFQMWNHTLI